MSSLASTEIRLASLLRVRGTRRVIAAHIVIDETTATATAQSRPAGSRLAFLVTGVTLYLTWNVATLIGAVTAGCCRTKARAISISGIPTSSASWASASVAASFAAFSGWAAS